VSRTMPAAQARRVDVRRSIVGDMLSCLVVKDGDTMCSFQRRGGGNE